MISPLGSGWRCHVTDVRRYFPRARVDLSLVPAGDGELTGAEGELLRLGAVAPRSVTVDCNDPEKADTWRAEFDLGHFPMDPKQVRAAIAAVHIGGVKGPRARLDTSSGDNIIVMGHADKVQRKLMGDRSHVSFEGRDYTSLFLDPDWGTLTLELGRPLDELVAEALEHYPGVGRMGLEVRGMASAPIIPAGNTQKTKAFTFSESGKVWDGLQELAGRAGAILTVDRDTVVIQPPRNVSPFDGTARPMFIDGRNLSNVEVTRKLSRDDVQNVRVKAMDPATFEVVEGVWPDPPRSVTKIQRTNGKTTSRTTEEEFRVFKVSHPNPTPGVLTEIAKRIWEARDQQALKVSMGTDELMAPAQIPGDLNHPVSWSYPVTRLRNGHTVRLHIDRGTRHMLDRPISQQRRELELRARGYSDPVAEVMAKSWRVLDRLMFVDSCTHKMGSESGYSLSIEAVNSLEI